MYLDSERWAEADDATRAVLQLRAYAATTDTPPVFCHESAALVHGLPLLGVRPDTIHLIAASDSRGRPEAGVRRHRRGSPPAVIEQDGLRVTSLDRTVVDIAAASPFRDAVVVADAAMRGGLDRRAMARAAADAGARASGRMRRVIEFATPLAESVGESVSRVVISELCLPAPVLQHPFSDSRGPIGRVDFWWPEQRVIGEFDGRIKYLGRFGGSAEEVIWREKQREDRLRALGPRFARWVWGDVMLPERLLDQLSRVGLSANGNGAA